MGKFKAMVEMGYQERSCKNAQYSQWQLIDKYNQLHVIITCLLFGIIVYLNQVYQVDQINMITFQITRFV